MTPNVSMVFDWRRLPPPIDGLMVLRLRDSGCPEAVISNDSYHRHWNEIHKWCEEHIGNRYSWCGDSFFFANEDDKLLFTLRWA